MKLLPLAVFLTWAGAQAQDAHTQDSSAPKPVTFTDRALGLSFDHPASWLPVKKGGKSHSKSDKFLNAFTLPTSGSPTGASLEIYEAPFNSTTEIWQSTQLRINEQLKRTVVKQWEQQILGVPLLLTRISYTEQGAPTSTLTGLLYSRTHKKLLFRLTGPTSDFDNVQYSFNSAIQTLRTVDGSLPAAEDPEHPLPAAKKTDPLPEPIKVLADPKQATHWLVPPEVVDLVVSTRKVSFRYPEGWSARDVKPTSLTLESPKLHAPIAFTFYSILDSDTPLNALINVSSKDLDQFATVALRLDSDPKENRAGCTIASVRRIGKSDKGALLTYEVSGQKDDYYFIATYRSTSPVPAEEDKVLSDLFKHVTLVSHP